MILIEVAQTKSSTFNNYCSLCGSLTTNLFQYYSSEKKLKMGLFIFYVNNIINFAFRVFQSNDIK